ncbi:MAG: asparagine synthase (glutamine-hydrolyzing) [Planctomycetes bacterium]|nr:asparagine synthase (glutamine-hydrolyzing) [Planctomycetota bacterium]
MCGICGYISGTDQPADRAVIAAMNERLRRRGPDDEGYFVRGPVALGMRRLSIIDLDTGQQPIANEDESVWVVLNGEIYNFQELRRNLEARGHRFRSRSDTEVIVHLYEDHGEGFVDHLNGMFAVAVWDGGRKRLVLARDRMGQKPLYWTRLGAGLAFASEPKSLLAHPDISPGLDPQSLSRYLLHEYVPAPWSIFRGVQKLEAAHRLVFASGEVRIDRYWEPAQLHDTNSKLTLADAAEQLWERFRESVRLQLVSDVPLGVFLSGGIDSSSVVAAMASILPPDRIETFTIGFDDPSFDESGPARLVAQHFRTNHHEENFSVPRLIEVLPEVADYLDEPFGDASVLPMYLLSQFARKGVTVALGGDGGDELLAGYPTFQAERPATIFRLLPRPIQRLMSWAANRLPVSHDNFSFDFKLKQFLKGAAAPPELAHLLWIGSFSVLEQQSLLTADLRAACGDLDVEQEHQALAKELSGRDRIDRLTRLYARTYLAEDILTKADRASMAVSLELRAPFLDPGLVSFITSLPSHYKLRGWQTKSVFRRAVAPHVPPSVLGRPKKGFGIPVARWLNTHLRELAGDLLAPSRLRAQGIFEPEAVERLLAEHGRGRRDNRKGLWTLLMFQLWHDRYGRRQ